MRQLTIASYRDGVAPLALDMDRIFTAESRLPEIVQNNKDLNRELLAVFLQAYFYAGQLLSMVQLHRQRCENELKKREAVVRLDVVPEVVKDKQLGTSRSPMGAEDIRTAILWKDEQYLKIQDALASLNAAESLIENKVRAFSQTIASLKLTMAPSEYPRFNNTAIVPNAFPADGKENIMLEGQSDWGEPTY